MKKLVAVLLLAVASTSAMAQHHGHRNHGHYGHNGYYRGNNWVAPAIIGGVIGYGLTRQYYEPYYVPPVVVQPPVYVQPQPVCTRYIYQDQYGNTLREETRCN
jgi:hypothetical protein